MAQPPLVTKRIEVDPLITAYLNTVEPIVVHNGIGSPTEGTPVVIRVVLHGRVEEYAHRVPDYEKATIEALVDLYEGQVGTVLTVKTVGLITLFQGMVEEGEFE